MTAEPSNSEPPNYIRRHIVIGWCSLLVFLTLGIVLETLHGLKIRWYLDTSNEIRRTMMTLAHAHGVLLGLVHFGFAYTVQNVSHHRESWVRLASPSLTGASITMPAGFLLGGFFIYSGDPGVGVLLVPIGGAFLFLAVAMTIWGIRS